MSDEQKRKFSIQALIIVSVLTILIPIHIMYVNGLTFSAYDKFLVWMLGPATTWKRAAYYGLTFMIYSQGLMHLKDNQKFVNLTLSLGLFWSIATLISSFIFNSGFEFELRISSLILLSLAVLLWWLDSTTLKKYNRTCKLIMLSNLDEASKYDLIHRGTILAVVITWII